MYLQHEGSKTASQRHTCQLHYVWHNVSQVGNPVSDLHGEMTLLDATKPLQRKLLGKWNVITPDYLTGCLHTLSAHSTSDKEHLRMCCEHQGLGFDWVALTVIPCWQVL